MRARVATGADTAAVTDVFALAFYEDPTWSWGFPDPERRLEQQRRWWGMFVNSALPYGWVWISEGGGAASLWVPPGRPDLSPEDEARFEPLLRELLGDRADQVLGFREGFEFNRPGEPHYYLSLLGTHPDHRGRGEGMGLLADNLDRIDAAGEAAYLESTNPANTHRYKALGFAPIGEFPVPAGGPMVTCMWRKPR